MKIHLLLPLASAIGIGFIATSCNEHRHHSTATVASEYRTGYQVRTLPPNYRTITYGGTQYYHHNNVYYRPHGRGYIVVDNPRVRTTTTRRYTTRTPATSVSVVRTLPRGYRVVTHNGVRYYHHGDSYYQATSGGYRIVANPYTTRRRGWR